MHPHHTLEKEMTTQSSIPAWRIPIDKGAWQARVLGIERLLLNEKRPGFLASGEEFNPGARDEA